MNINKNLPLLICDADEVLFEFMKSFEIYLNENQMFFSYNSFKLNGNIFNIANNKSINSAEIPNIINDFFKNYTIKMPLIYGAKETLKKLSDSLNIIILSNIPETSALDRMNYLKQNDMNYNFISNRGPKGSICKNLSKLTTKTTFFIDDLPNQIKSVKKESKKIITIHFLQNTKLLKIIPKVEYSDYNTNNWEQIYKIIMSKI